MSQRTETWTSRFYIYPKDIAQFIEYCKRFECIKNVEINFVVDEKIIDESILYKPAFVADVTHFSEMDSLKFVNVFSLFFSLSKYCSRI
jgi:hypothetical protein